MATTERTTAGGGGGEERRLLLEVWADVACPFCAIGDRYLREALAEWPQAGSVDVRRRAFLLAPDAPRREDGDIHAVLARRKGIGADEARAMNARVTEIARGAGLAFDMDRVVPVNTADAHRVIQMGEAQGRGGDVAARMYAAYFEDGEDLSDHGVLARLGAEAGLDAAPVGEALAGDGYADAVAEDVMEARRLGLDGVPAFVIGRAYLVSGAQPPAALRQALTAAWEAGA